MANTGNGGEDQMATDNRAMAGDSARSTRHGRRPTGATAPVSPAHALEMLASAVNYLRGSGLRVATGNASGVLVVGVYGAEFKDGAFVLASAGKDDGNAPTG